MQGAILHTNSDHDLKLILQLARKLGISTKELTSEEIEDYGISNAISEGRTGNYIDTNKFLNELKDDSKD